MDINKIFKIGVLVLGVVFLLLYFFNSQSGQYEIGGGVGAITVLNKRTGVVYILDEEMTTVNPLTKKISTTRYKSM